MKPTRPIKTFDKWFRHQVTLVIDRKEHEGVKRLLSAHGLQFGQDYLMSSTFSGEQYLYLHFEDIYHANWCIKQYKRKPKVDVLYEFQPPFHGPLRNKEITGNFTLDDLKAIVGDPLPPRVKYLLADLERRNINYFYDFAFMHQEWGRKWWPVAFVFHNPYRDKNYDASYRERMVWCRDNGVVELKTHACGMMEFGDMNQAMLFKLTFGEDPLPRK